MSMTTAQTPHCEYATRPPDERYPSLDSMIAAALADKNHSVERTYNLKDLQVAAADTEGHTGAHVSNRGVTTLRLMSPKGTAKFTHWSFGQLCRSLGAPAAYLRALPPAIAADALNFGLQDSAAGTSANMLVRAPNGNAQAEPILRACTSDSYGRAWDAGLYDGLRRNLRADDRWTTPPTWSGEPAGVYRGDRDSFVMLINGGSIVTDPSLTNRAPAAGIAGGGNDGPSDGMYRGIMVRNSEVGACSVQIETVLYRYICGNHLLWGAVTDSSFRRRHVGVNVSRDTIREIGRIAYNYANSSTARDNAIIRSLIDNEIAHTKEAVIDELRRLGAGKEDAEAMYETCERTESASPRSFWGLAQGATRISQEATHQDERLSLDRIGAAILAKGARQYARV